MARRDFRRGAAAIRQSRLTQWLEFPPIRSSFSITGAALFFTLTDVEKALRPFTIVRTRILVGIVSDQSIASEVQIGAVGMAVVSDQAEAIGITAVPTPITDMASDLWFVHQLLFNEFTFLDATGFQDQSMRQYAIDSKAMRKVQDGEDVILSAESSSSAGTGGFTLAIGGRILVKLH